MADFNVPSQGLVNPNVYESPFMRAWQEERRVGQAAPFVDMARQSQGMNLDQQRMEQQEFMSPAAQQLRQAQIGAKTAEANYTTMTKPVQGEKDVASWRAEIEALPAMTREKIAKAEQNYNQIKATPQVQLYQSAAAMYDHLSKVPEEARPLVWNNFVQRLRQTNPQAQLPPDMEQYSPELMANLGATKYALVNDIDQTQKRELEELKGQKTIQAAQISGNAHITAAQIGANGAVTAAGVRANTERPESPAQMEARLRDLVASGKASPEDKATWQSILEEKWQRFENQDAELKPLSVMSALRNDPALTQRYNSLRAQKRAQFMQGQMGGTGQSNPALPQVPKSVTWTDFTKQYPMYANRPKDQVKAALKKQGIDLTD